MHMQVLTRVLEGCVWVGCVLVEDHRAPGFKIHVQPDGDNIKPDCFDLPTSSLEGVVVNLRNLGGHAGTYWILSMKSILLIHVKMPTVVGILTFMSKLFAF